jgi:hypothetical protein
MAIKRWNASTSQWELVGTPGTATPAAIGAATITSNTFSGVQTLASASEWPLISRFTNPASTHRNHLLLQRSNNNGAVTSGFTLGGISMSGHDGTNYGLGWNGGAEITAYASQNWTPTNRGTSLSFLTTPDNTTAITERMRITANGKLLFGNNSEPANPYSVHITGGVVINQMTDISPSAGAAGQLTIGGNGYSGFVALDATAMHIGHNSGSRDLILATDETERLRVQAGGNIKITGGSVGVGTGPKYIISITGNSDESTYLGREAYWTLIGANNNEGWKFRNSGGQNVLTMNAGASGYNASMLGSLTQNASDIRLKKNIVGISDALNKVKSLNGFTYNWNELANELVGFNMEENEVGLFAQEVNNVLPEAVKIAPFDTDNGINESVSGENYLTVQYEKIIPLLVEAIKELSAKVESLSNND